MLLETQLPIYIPIVQQCISGLFLILVALISFRLNRKWERKREEDQNQRKRIEEAMETANELLTLILTTDRLKQEAISEARSLQGILDYRREIRGQDQDGTIAAKLDTRYDKAFDRTEELRWEFRRNLTRALALGYKLSLIDRGGLPLVEELRFWGVTSSVATIDIDGESDAMAKVNHDRIVNRLNSLVNRLNAELFPSSPTGLVGTRSGEPAEPG
jgi:hypothetical protein